MPKLQKNKDGRKDFLTVFFYVICSLGLPFVPTLFILLFSLSEMTMAWSRWPVSVQGTPRMKPGHSMVTIKERKEEKWMLKCIGKPIMFQVPDNTYLSSKHLLDAC